MARGPEPSMVSELDLGMTVKPHTTTPEDAEASSSAPMPARSPSPPPETRWSNPALEELKACPRHRPQGLHPKCEIKRALEAQLIDKGILPERAESLGRDVFPGWKGSPGVALSSTLDTAAAEAAARSGLRIDPGSSLSPGLDPHLAIRLKELELEIKIQEREAEILRLWALQIDADRELELRRMNLAAARPAPLPRSTASLGCSLSS
ncbi:hypothetical protein MHYP_G00280340 [Metynnis hypsauchen]